MVVKIGINGFGCIGCNVFCVVLKNDNVEVVVINDLIDVNMFVYFLKYDFVYGKLDVEVVVDGSNLVVNGKIIEIFVECDLV